MVQETRRARFQLEASQSIGIRRIRGGQNLDGDVPADPRDRARDTLRPCLRRRAATRLRRVPGGCPWIWTCSGAAIIRRPGQSHCCLTVQRSRGLPRSGRPGLRGAHRSGRTECASTSWGCSRSGPATGASSVSRVLSCRNARLQRPDARLWRFVDRRGRPGLRGAHPSGRTECASTSWGCSRTGPATGASSVGGIKTVRPAVALAKARWVATPSLAKPYAAKRSRNIGPLCWMHT